MRGSSGFSTRVEEGKVSLSLCTAIFSLFLIFNKKRAPYHVTMPIKKAPLNKLMGARGVGVKGWAAWVKRMGYIGFRSRNE